MTDRPAVSTQAASAAHDAAHTCDATAHGGDEFGPFLLCCVDAAVAAAAPHIAAQALRDAAKAAGEAADDASERARCDSHDGPGASAYAGGLHAAAARLHQAADELAAHPSSPASTRTDLDDDRHRDCPAAHCGSWALHTPHGDCPGTTRS